jgi:HEAT repeat protein
MEFVAGVFASWLLGQLAGAGRKRLVAFVIGDELERALRAAASDAIHLTAADFCPADASAAQQLEMVIDHLFADPVADQAVLPAVQPTLLQTVQAGIGAALAPLDDANITGIGRSSADLLGVRGDAVAKALTGHLLREVVKRGWRGGPLQPVANQIGHEATQIGIDRLDLKLEQLSEAIWEVHRAQLRPGVDVRVTADQTTTLNSDLRSYLETAVRAAQEHPYPGVVPGLTPPPLTAVYLHQQAQPLAAGISSVAAPADAAGGTAQMIEGESPEIVPAETVLDCAGDCVIVGDPGVGKSSLLRTTLIRLAQDMLAGSAGLEVPVQVLSAELVDARPLPEAIAAAVTTNLSTVGLLGSWGPEFFGRAPWDGARWLVLVDGLDEVLDPQARRQVLDKLRGIRDGQTPSPYRFVIATRPLAGSEFPSSAAWPLRRFELQPFKLGEVGDFAKRWFAALGLSQPAQAATRFRRALDKAQLGDAARTPLMATMLCQLFAIDPARSLPTSRIEAYHEYVELLRTRQYFNQGGGIYAQTERVLGPYGSLATIAGTGLLNTAFDLIARLADSRLTGDARDAVELLETWTAGSRPRHVPVPAWRAFLAEILRGSGILTHHSGDFLFIHQTVAEFLGAQHVAGNAERSAAAFNHLFGHWLVVSPSSGLRWQPPEWDESYSRFLVGAWRGRPGLDEALSRLATSGGLKGCGFVVSLVTDGTVTDADLISEAACALAGIAASSSSRVTEVYAAAQELVQLSDSRGFDLLADLAAGARGADSAISYGAAQWLVRHADVRGIDLLAGIVANVTVSPGTRHRSAEAVARLNRIQGTHLLVQLASEPTLAVLWRRRSAESLLRLNDPRGADLLAGLAADTALPIDGRVAAAEQLAQVGDYRSHDLLVDLLCVAVMAEGRDAYKPVRDGKASLPPQARDRAEPVGLAAMRAAVVLARLGDDSASARLIAIATNAGNDPGIRELGVRALSKFNEPCSPDELLAIADDVQLSARNRSWAAIALTKLKDPRAPELLARMAVSPDPAVRRRAVAAIDQLTDPRGRRLLAALAIDTSADSASRASAAEALGLLGDPRGPRLLAALAAEERVNSSERQQVRKTLQRLVSEIAHPWFFYIEEFDGPDLRSRSAISTRRRNSLLVVAGESIFEPSVRAVAFDGLVEFFDSDSARLLKALAADNQVDPAVKKEANKACSRMTERLLDFDLPIFDAEFRLPRATALAELGHPRGVKSLAEIAVDADLDIAIRSGAAKALARFGDPAGSDQLAAMITDPDIDITLRCELAEELAATGDGRGVEQLFSIAADEDTGGPVRCDAATTLARLGDPRGAQVLAEIAAEVATASTARCIATESLASLDDPSQARHLAFLAADPQLHPATRIEAAEGLTRLGDRRGSELLAGMRHDPTLNSYARQWARARLNEASSFGQ